MYVIGNIITFRELVKSFFTFLELSIPYCQVNYNVKIYSSPACYVPEQNSYIRIMLKLDRSINQKNQEYRCKTIATGRIVKIYDVSVRIKE